MKCIKQITLVLIYSLFFLLAVGCAQTHGTPKAPHDILTWAEAKKDVTFGQYVPTVFPEGYSELSFEKYTENIPEEEHFLRIFAKKNDSDYIGTELIRKPENGNLDITEVSPETILAHLTHPDTAVVEGEQCFLSIDSADMHMWFNFTSLSQEEIIAYVMSIPACKQVIATTDMVAASSPEKVFKTQIIVNELYELFALSPTETI